MRSDGNEGCKWDFTFKLSTHANQRALGVSHVSIKHNTIKIPNKPNLLQFLCTHKLF